MSRSDRIYDKPPLLTVAQVKALCKPKSVVYDIKRVLPRSAVDAVL